MLNFLSIPKWVLASCEGNLTKMLDVKAAMNQHPIRAVVTAFYMHIKECQNVKF